MRAIRCIEYIQFNRDIKMTEDKLICYRFYCFKFDLYVSGHMSMSYFIRLAENKWNSRTVYTQFQSFCKQFLQLTEVENSTRILEYMYFTYL